MKSRVISSVVRWVGVVAITLAVVGPAPRAQAQFGMDARSMDVSVTRRSVDTMAKVLNMSKEQKVAAVMLYEGYKNEYNASRDKMEAGMKSIQEKVADTQDFTLFQKEMPKLAQEFRERSEAIEKTFMNDVKSALNDDQLSKWPKIERLRRREQFMRIGMVTGAAVDLTRVLDRAKAMPEGGGDLQNVVDRYEVDMDRHLVEMQRVQREAEEKMMKGEGNMFDMGRVQEMLKTFYEVGKDMRETNKTYARKMAMLMDETARSRFEDEVNLRAFPRVYKQGHVVKQMDAAEKLPDLGAGKKAEIATMKETYLREVAAANEKWAKAIEDRDDKGGGTFAVMMQSMQGGGGDLNKEVNAARQVRKELDAKLKDRLEGMLTDDQKAQLPPAPPEQRGNPWADFMPEPDDDGE